MSRSLWAQVSSPSTDTRLGQLACFTAGPLLLVLALLAVARFAATGGELVIGVLASLSLSLLLVVLGMVLPLSRQRADS